MVYMAGAALHAGPISRHELSFLKHPSRLISQKDRYVLENEIYHRAAFGNFCQRKCPVLPPTACWGDYVELEKNAWGINFI